MQFFMNESISSRCFVTDSDIDILQNLFWFFFQISRLYFALHL